MRKRAWWGVVAGMAAGLIMLACVLILAAHGQPDCIRPFSAFASAGSAAVSDPAALALGVGLHEAVAATMGLLGMCWLSTRPRYGIPLWLLGGVLGMALLDRAVLAWRMPAMIAVMSAVQALPYLTFGVALSAVALGPGLVKAVQAAGGGPSTSPAAPTRVVLGAVVEHPTLEVLIVPHCFGCERAAHLTAEAQARFPGLAVRLVDLERFRAPLPAGVVAVPAYILNGRVLFTGNPTAEALHQALARAVTATGSA